MDAKELSPEDRERIERYNRQALERFRAERDQMLVDLYCRGFSTVELARLTGLSRTRIYQRIVAVQRAHPQKQILRGPLLPGPTNPAGSW